MSWKVVIVGLGNIGFKYDLGQPEHIVHSHARALSRLPEFELVGGVDPDDSNREAFHRAYAVAVDTAIGDLCGRVQPDIVVIASPTANHLDNIRETLACCRPALILLEKPAAYSEQLARQMVALCDAASVPVLVNLIRRTEPAMAAVKTMIENGEIELPCKGVVWYSKGLIHSGCHFVDLLTWWLGDVSTVECIDSGRRLNDCDLSVDLRVCFGKSEVYFLANDGAELSYYSVELIAGNGRLRIGHGDIRVGWQAKSETANVIGSGIREIENELHQYQLNVVKDIVEFMVNGKCLLPTLSQHVETMQPIYAVNDSRGNK